MQSRVTSAYNETFWLQQQLISQGFPFMVCSCELHSSFRDCFLRLHVYEKLLHSLYSPPASGHTVLSLKRFLTKRNVRNPFLCFRYRSSVIIAGEKRISWQDLLLATLERAPRAITHQDMKRFGYKLGFRRVSLHISFPRTVELANYILVFVIVFLVYTSSCKCSIHSILPNFHELKAKVKEIKQCDGLPSPTTLYSQ